MGASLELVADALAQRADGVGLGLPAPVLHFHIHGARLIRRVAPEGHLRRTEAPRPTFFLEKHHTKLVGAHGDNAGSQPTWRACVMWTISRSSISIVTSSFPFAGTSKPWNWSVSFHESSPMSAIVCGCACKWRRRRRYLHFAQRQDKAGRARNTLAEYAYY